MSMIMQVVYSQAPSYIYDIYMMVPERGNCLSYIYQNTSEVRHTTKHQTKNVQKKEQQSIYHLQNCNDTTANHY